MSDDTIHKLREFMIRKKLDQTEIAGLIDCSEGLVSGVLNGKVTVSKNFKKSVEALLATEKTTVINGDNHKIDIRHVSDVRERYSPATEMILDIIKDWEEKKRRKLAVQAESMNEEE